MGFYSFFLTVPKTKYEFIKTMASLWNASVAVHKRQKQPAENCDHWNHFFSFRPAHFKLEKHTTEIPVILLSKDVGNPSRVKNQGDRQMILI